ncbi:hypothetical protein CBS101457_005624 [Exobasidium rhododendri]|nr:hypothetical protein CBS101457_005624 [Exobasidium rhododendri]
MGISPQDAFTDAWRSYRIRQGDNPATLADPVGDEKRKRAKKKQKKSNEKVPEDAGGGGFLVEEDAADDYGGFGSGGFIVDEEMDVEEEVEAEVKLPPEHIPLSSVPDALASLSLPTNDNFILDLFAQTATYIDKDPRRRRRAAADSVEAGEEKMVSLRDFQRVVDVLVEDDVEKEGSDVESGVDGEDSDDQEERIEGEGEEVEMEDEEEKENPLAGRARPVRAAASTANKRRKKQLQEQVSDDNSDEEDAYNPDSADEEEMPSAVQKPRKTIRLTHKRKAESKAEPRKSASGGSRRQRGRSGKGDDVTATDDDNENEEDEGHLTTHQRRQVSAAFKLFTNKLEEVRGRPLDDQPRLSKEDLKLLVHSVGEKIPEKEIEEMIDEGIRFFAKASSRDVTRQSAKLRRDAAAGRATARGETNRSTTVGIDEFAGVLLKGRLI